MNLVQNGVLVWFAIAGLLAGPVDASMRATQGTHPEATVRSLYQAVELRAPSGLLSSPDRRIFMPYLSGSLRRKMNLAAACEKDWLRQNPEEAEKAPFSWSEFGLFSGANERISPGKFQIKNVRKDDDGSFYIVVAFMYRPVGGTGSWAVTDHVIREGGRFVVDDVIFPKEGIEDVFTLSARLSEGCNGSRWVGLRLK